MWRNIVNVHYDIKHPDPAGGLNNSPNIPVNVEITPDLGNRRLEKTSGWAKLRLRRGWASPNHAAVAEGHNSEDLEASYEI